jgi:hypothetical protein
MNGEIATPPKKPSVYIEVTCKGETVHAYTIAAPLQERPELRSPLPLVPRFCAYCKPPEKTGPHGIATDRKFNVAGGIFIGSWRHTRVDDVNQPVGDPQPVQDVTESVHAA